MRDHAQMLAALRQNGIARVPWRMADCLNFRKYLMEKRCYKAHVKVYAKGEASFFEACAAKWPAFCNSMQDVIGAPGWFETALEFLPLARSYFGEEPLLYSVNAFWTQPSPEQYDMTHGWHRDEDDRKQLVLFMLGADTDPNGAHLYARASHDCGDGGLGYDFGNPPPHVVEQVYGIAGTMFLCDTRGLHMGKRPASIRLLAWARFGVSDPPESYKWDKLEPVPKKILGSRYPTDPALQRAVKLVTA